MFTLSLIIEGATEKVSQFIMLIKLILNKTFDFNEQNFFLGIAERFKQQKYLFKKLSY